MITKDELEKMIKDKRTVWWVDENNEVQELSFYVNDCSITGLGDLRYWSSDGSSWEDISPKHLYKKKKDAEFATTKWARRYVYRTF